VREASQEVHAKASRAAPAPSVARFRHDARVRRLRDRTAALVCGLVLLLSLATVYDQYRGLSAISDDQNPRHFVQFAQPARVDRILRGEGGDPWQYRVASEWLAKESERAAKLLGFRDTATVGLLTFRVLQNIAIFALAWLLYRRFGLSRAAAAIGLALVAYAMTQSLYNVGLAFDTYGDLIVYLAAGVLIIDRRYAWIVPLTIVGAINRETCALVPVMLLATALRLGVRTDEGRRAALLGLASLMAFGVTLATVRLVVGPGDLIIPYGHHHGWDLFKFNVTRGITWDNVFRTLTIVPLVALWQYPRWPPALRTFALAVVPVWVVVHLFAAVIAETRLLLVPYVLVFVPGALMAFTERKKEGMRHPAVVSD
jgi:hypothetical protein